MRVRKVPERRENAAENRNGSGRRKPHLLRSRTCPYTFPIARALRAVPASCSGSGTNCGASAISAVRGRTWANKRIVGVAGTNPGQVGLRHEHAEGPAVERAASAASSSGSPSRRQSSTGSRIARARMVRQSCRRRGVPDPADPRPDSRETAEVPIDTNRNIPIASQKVKGVISLSGTPRPSETENLTWAPLTRAISRRA